jgi:hypothetical protein
MRTNKKIIMLKYFSLLLVLGSFIALSPICLAAADSSIAKKSIIGLNFEQVLMKILEILVLAGIISYCACYLIYINKNEAKIAKISRINNIDISEALLW